MNFLIGWVPTNKKEWKTQQHRNQTLGHDKQGADKTFTCKHHMYGMNAAGKLETQTRKKRIWNDGVQHKQKSLFNAHQSCRAVNMVHFQALSIYWSLH